MAHRKITIVRPQLAIIQSTHRIQKELTSPIIC